MAILAKNYLLCLLMVSVCFGEGVKYFDKRIQFFDFGQGCEECDEETNIIDTNKKTKENKQKQYQILVFISLKDGAKNKKVIQEVKQFLNRNSEFEARGFLIDKIENFKQLALENYELFDNTFEFEFDPLMEEAIKRKVNYVPMVIVLEKNKEIKRIVDNFYNSLLEIKGKNEKLDKKEK